MSNRIGILSHHPAPYRDLIFHKLSMSCKVDPTVILLNNMDYGHTEWDYKKPSYNTIIIKDTSKYFLNKFSYIKIALILIREKYDVLIIPGINFPECLISIIYSLLTNTKYIITIDSIDAGRFRGLKLYIINKVKLFILRHAASLFVPGEASTRYFMQIGIPRNKIFQGAYCLDSEGISSEVSINRLKIKSLREKYSIPSESWCLLSVGKLIATRNYPLLIKAIKEFPFPDRIYLIIVGNGEDGEILGKLINQYSLVNIKIIDSLKFSELSEVYALADVYIHPGQEPFSTATEFAALSKLPIICTSQLGFSQDLLYSNGLPIFFESCNSSDLSRKILWTLRHKNDAEKCGASNYEAASRRNLKWALNQLEMAILQ